MEAVLLWGLMAFNTEHLPTSQECLERHMDYHRSAQLLKSHLDIGGGTYEWMYRARLDDLQTKTRFWELMWQFTQPFKRCEESEDGTFSEEFYEEFNIENIEIRRSYLNEIIRIAGERQLRKGIFP